MARGGSGDRGPAAAAAAAALAYALCTALWMVAVSLEGVAAWPGVRQKPPQGNPLEEQLVVDVDAGVDDAVALLLLFGHERRAGESPAGRVSAITCSHGNTNLPNVVRNVFRTLRVANRTDVPVYPGASRSLLRTPPSDNYFGLDGFGDAAEGAEGAGGQEDAPQEEHAVNALIRTVRGNPGRVTLLCLGPLTNVALAERMSEGFVSQLKELIVLGGSVEGHGNVRPGVEFNVYMDPEAFAVVLEAAQAARRPLTLLPWETVLKRVRLPLEWRRGVLGSLGSDAMRLLNLVERRHLGPPPPSPAVAPQVEDAKGESWWPAADAVATAVMLRPRLATRTLGPLYVQVDTGLGPGRATQQVDYGNITGQSPNARIVVGVDREGLQLMLLENLS